MPKEPNSNNIRILYKSPPVKVRYINRNCLKFTKPLFESIPKKNFKIFKEKSKKAINPKKKNKFYSPQKNQIEEKHDKSSVYETQLTPILKKKRNKRKNENNSQNFRRNPK